MWNEDTPKSKKTVSNEEEDDSIYGVDVEDLVVKYANNTSSFEDAENNAALRGVTLKIPRGALFMILDRTGLARALY